MKRAFVGSFSTHAMSINDNYMSQAGFYFQRKLIRLAHPSEIIWIHPINLFKTRYSYKYLRRISRQLRNRVAFMLFRIIISGLPPHFLQIFHQLTLKIPDSKNIWLYNSELNNIFYVFRLFVHKKNIYIVLADTSTTGVHSLVTKIGLFLCKSYISLSKSGLELNPAKCPKLAHGIAEPSFRSIEDVQSNQDKQAKYLIDYLVSQQSNSLIVYSGSIGPSTGLDLVLDTAPNLRDVTILVTGKPYYISYHQLKSRIESTPNVIYLGMLSFSTYQYLLSNAALALSLREPKPEHSFNFPSKIIEYLSYGLPVITTIDYNLATPPLFYCNKFSPKALEKSILLALNYCNSSLADLAIDYSKKFSPAAFLSLIEEIELRS